MEESAEGGAEVALVATSLTGRDDVGDDRHRHGHQAAGAEPLDAPEGDQLEHVLTEPGEGRPDQEHDDGELEDPFRPNWSDSLP